MKGLLALPCVMAIHASAFGQPSVHVAFNIGNCEAHSRQIGSLKDLHADIPKILILNRLDSALTPWVMERFDLEQVPNLFMRYEPTVRLVRHLSSFGQSVVFVISGTDTVAGFAVEELPERVNAINAIVAPSSQGSGQFPPSTGHEPAGVVPGAATEDIPDHNTPHRTYKIARDAAYPPIGSNVQFVASRGWIWLLDRFLGNLYRIDVERPENAELVFIGSVTDLLMAGTRDLSANDSYSKMIIQADGIVHVDRENGQPTILVNCTDTIVRDAASGRPRYFHVLMTVHADGTISVIRVVYPVREDGITPTFSSNAYWRDGQDLVTQVFHYSPTNNKYPLFGKMRHSGDSLIFVEVAPYEYRSHRWKNIGPYNIVNGFFCEKCFIYSVMPVLIDLNGWTEHDLSNRMGLSIETLSMEKLPEYFTMDMKCDDDHLDILYMISGQIHLAEIMVDNGNMELERMTPIDIGTFPMRGAVLMDRQQVVLLSDTLDELMIVGSGSK